MLEGMVKPKPNTVASKIHSTGIAQDHGPSEHELNN